LAATNGDEAVVKLLFDTGKIDADAKDRDGRTPLSWAAANGPTNEEATGVYLLQFSTNIPAGT
jgi:ankyrin repeat protein